MKKLLLLIVVVALISIPVRADIMVGQISMLSADNLAVGGWGCWFVPPTTSSNTGTWGVSTEADDGKSYGITNAGGIFSQNATAMKGGVASNSAQSVDGANGAALDKMLTANTMDCLKMESSAVGNAQAVQSMVKSNSAMAIGPDGLAAAGSMVGVVQINTAMSGGLATSSVKVSDSANALVILPQDNHGGGRGGGGGH